jgi:predicted transposase YdaD
MKTDALFYQLFQTLPDLFFELTGLTYSESYQFQSVELKQTAPKPAAELATHLFG